MADGTDLIVVLLKRPPERDQSTRDRPLCVILLYRCRTVCVYGFCFFTNINASERRLKNAFIAFSAGIHNALHTPFVAAPAARTHLLPPLFGRNTRAPRSSRQRAHEYGEKIVESIPHAQMRTNICKRSVRDKTMYIKPNTRNTF